MTPLRTTPGTAADKAETSPESRLNHKDNKYLAECYALALHCSAEYALDFDSSATREFQQHVGALEERISAETTPEVLHLVQVSFRGELRLFHEKGVAYLKWVRDEMEGVAEAMQAFAGNFIANGQDVQERVRGEMSNLEKVAETGDLVKIRQSIHAASVEVARSYEQLNKANALAILELQHEIRLLHREMDAERRAAWTDAASGAWIKKKIDDRVDELIANSEAFCVIVILVSNLKRLEKQCNPTVVNAGLQSLVKRFYSVLGEGSIVARLSSDQFAAVLEVDASAGQTIAREAGERLSSRYSAQNNGIAQSIDLRVTCGIVAHPRGGDPDDFRRKLQQMTGSVETVE
jgi:GGDEF domain-containing protein